MIFSNWLAGISVAFFLFSCQDKEQKTDETASKNTVPTIDTIAKSSSQNLNEPIPDSSVKNIDTATLASYICIVKTPYFAKIGKRYFSIAENNINGFLQLHKKELQQQKLWLISSKSNSFKTVIDVLDEFEKNDIKDFDELGL